MSDVTNCLTCGAVRRILGQDAEGLPKLGAFQNKVGFELFPVARYFKKL